MINPLILLPIGLAGALFALVATRLGKALAKKQRSLKPHFRRLGEIAPTHPCPCHKPSGVYGHCCRPRDIEKLEQDVRTFIFNDWMRRSGGRSRARSMKARLEDFPMSEVTFPDWVTSPKDYTFPIEESVLRSWSPISTRRSPLDAMDSADNVPI